MSKTTTQEEKLVRMTESRLPELILSLATPTIVSMLVSALYNMADTYFVGLIGNASATGAIGVAFPMTTVMQAVAFMLGHGSGNRMSRSLGAGDVEDARRYASTGFYLSLMTGVAMGLAGLCWTDGLTRLLGATDTIAPYAREYVRFLMPGAPFLVGGFVLNNQLRFQGSAFYSMLGMTAGTVLNIVLDPLFIFVLDMGVTGAAVATSLGQAVSFAVLLCMTFRGSNIPVLPRNFSPTAERLKEIFRGGVPSLARQGLMSLTTVCLNVAAGGFGDAAVAAMSIVSRVMQICNSAIIGLGQGFQPVCGFNYGAGLFRRVREAFWFCVRLSTLALTAAAVAAALFAPQIVGLFIKDSPEVCEIGATALRWQCATLPAAGFVIMANMMLQTVGMAGRATLLASARQGLFLIPAVLILPGLFGLFGLEISQTAGDLLSFALSIPVTLPVLRQFRQEG